MPKRKEKTERKSNLPEGDVLPQAFAERMRQMLGDEWEAFEKSCGLEPQRALRFNTRKPGWSPEREAGILRSLGIVNPEAVRWAEHAWYYESCIQPGHSLYHEAGVYYIQEPSAMSAAALLAPEKGSRVLDLCAAPGGKSTQLASSLPEGLLVANEIHPARSRILSQNIERMGIDNCIVTNEDGHKLADRLPAFFHYILVDAPCSGEGMFRKNDEALFQWSPDNVRMCSERQADILDCAARMLMPGGWMVYSTCTFAPEEDEGTIAGFLQRHPDFSLEEPGWFAEGNAGAIQRGCPGWGDENPDLSLTVRLWPQRVRGEGHFLALLRRDAEGSLYPEGAKLLPGGGNGAEYRSGNREERLRRADRRQKRITDPKCRPDRRQREVLQEFFRENLTGGAADRLQEKELLLYGSHLYAVPEGCPDLSGIRVQRAGLHLGSIQKDRFEPSHALALALGPADVLRTADFPAASEEAAAYAGGEALARTGDPGWTLVCVDGFSLGWGKQSGGQLKNHYPKGLRR